MVLCSTQFVFSNITQNYQFSVSIFKGWVATASFIARFMDIVGAWTSFHELNYALGLTHLKGQCPTYVQNMQLLRNAKLGQYFLL